MAAASSSFVLSTKANAAPTVDARVNPVRAASISKLATHSKADCGVQTALPTFVVSFVVASRVRGHREHRRSSAHRYTRRLGRAFWVGSRRQPLVRVAAARTARDRLHGVSVSVGDASAECLRVLFLGGSGRIGAAAAAHLARRSLDSGICSNVKLELVGRDSSKGEATVEEVVGDLAGLDGVTCSFRQSDWSIDGALDSLLAEVKCDALLHTAGPFDTDTNASVLRAAIRAQVPVYIDVADPIGYIANARALSTEAKDAGTMALISAGAFPGFSNVLAVECGRRLCPVGEDASESKVHDLNFAYFTAGLGGSGAVNLLITNLGFGEPMPVFRDGQYVPQLTSGEDLRKVSFFVEDGDESCHFIGERDVWNWPFPEAATVAEHFGISGSSTTGMGTAPSIWNTILVALVSFVPRHLWTERWFSEGLAWFSLPMVWVTDQFVSEKHAMRVEATSTDGRKCIAVQTHQSFRMCVAQSTAEFALELIERCKRRSEAGSSWKPGVWLPEELADDVAHRPRLLERLSNTPGTVSCDFLVEE